MSKFTKSQEQKFLSIVAASLFVVFGVSIGLLYSDTGTTNTATGTVTQFTSGSLSDANYLEPPYYDKYWCEQGKLNGNSYGCQRVDGARTGVKCTCQPYTEPGPVNGVYNVNLYDVFCNTTDTNACPVDLIPSDDGWGTVDVTENSSGGTTTSGGSTITYTAGISPICRLGSPSAAFSWTKTTTPLNSGIFAGSYYFVLVTDDDSPILSPSQNYWFTTIDDPNETYLSAEYLISSDTFQYWDGSKLVDGQNLTKLRTDKPMYYRVLWPGVAKDTGWRKFSAVGCPANPSTISRCTTSGIPSARSTWSTYAEEPNSLGAYYYLIIATSRVKTNANYWYVPVSSRGIRTIGPNYIYRNAKYWDGTTTTDRKIKFVPGKRYHYMLLYPGDGASTSWRSFISRSCS